ncbi:MAG: FAD-dependent oxidoreductase [Proteobacteria bacterium]|nr:FAD-dependent oxidoreductase [Pseudomonadota bacterium]
MTDPIIIVGGGQAAASLAIQLRDLGYAKPVMIIGEEAAPPYQRPPLSKKYLSGEWADDRLYLRTPEAWAASNITVRTGAKVSRIDPATKTVSLAGEKLRYGKLALATGAVSRPLPPQFVGLDQVYELRNLADVDRLRAAFHPGKRMAVIGGGFIGLETAAVAAKTGLKVTVIERAPRILERAVGAATSDHFRALHEGYGVRILESCGVNEVQTNDGTIALSLSNGETLEVDLVLVGIGVLPATALAEAAGIAVDNGIATDAYGRTSAPEIWAAGDCASFPYGKGRLRLESVQNAIDQAKAVAADMLGRGQPYHPYPWFWSDQYDAKLQISGLFNGFDQVITRKGRAGVAHWYFRDGRFVAVEAINEPAAFMTGRKLLEAGAALDAALMADESFDPRRCL